MRYWPRLFRQDDQTMAKFIFYVSLDQDEGLAMFFFSIFWEIEREAIEIYSPISFNQTAKEKKNNRDRTNDFILFFSHEVSPLCFFYVIVRLI